MSQHKTNVEIWTSLPSDNLPSEDIQIQKFARKRIIGGEKNTLGYHIISS